MKKVLSMLLVLAMMLSLISVTTVASTAEQVTTGTKLENATQLAAAGEYYMTADVEYTGTDAITIANGVVLYGNGYTLKTAVSFRVAADATVAFNNVVFNTTNSLIGVVTGATVSFTDCTRTGDISSTAAYVGGYIGGMIDVASTITFTNCINEGNVTSTSTSIAGFIGGVQAAESVITFNQCTNKAVIVGFEKAGGFFGTIEANITVSFTDCKNAGEISTRKKVGGFVGDSWDSPTITFTRCENNAPVKTGTFNNAYYEYAAGFIGVANGGTATFIGCVNNGDAQSKKCTGGFVGWAYNGELVFTGCTNNGTVISQWENTAGFVGLLNDTSTASLTNCINTGKIACENNRAVGVWAGSGATTVTATNCVDISADVAPTKAPQLFGTQETAPEGSKQKVRFVALIDSLKYDEVGFVVTSQVNGGTVKEYGSRSVNKAYMSLKAGEDVITVEQVNEDFQKPICKYLCALTFKDVPTTGTVVFTVQTYAKTATETMTGAEYTVTYQNGAFVSIELAGAKIPLSDLVKYVIVKSDRANAATTSLADRLKARINALEGGASCAVKGDTVIAGSLLFREQECEILIGNTNRAQTLAYKKTLRGDDYGYTLIDKKIVIYGFNDETLEKAIDLFISQVLSDGALLDGVLFAEAEAVTKEGEYRTNRVTVGNTSIKDCVIVYPKDDTNAKSRAQDLEAFLLDSVGFWVPVQSDATARQDGVYEILIGKTNREEQAPDNLAEHMAYVASEDGATLVDGADAMGLFHACTLFKQMFVTQESSLKVEIETPISEAADDAILLRVMSFNLQTSPSTERLEAGITVIKKYSPSILGVQEADDQWMGALKAGLTEYAYVGVGRDKNLSGEHSAIFYKKAEFNCLDSGTKWLSDTPNVPGSKYEESDYIRIVTWALLERKSDGKKFLFVNTHMDGDQINLEQFKVLMDLIKEYHYDTLITGDFNTRASSETYTYIEDQGFQDSLHQAEIFHATSEFPDIANYNGRRVDYIWIKANSSYVSDYHVIREYINGTQPSDHPAIYVDMLLP